MEWIKRWLGSGSPDIKPATAVRRRGYAVPPLVFRKDTTLPIVDWDAMDAHAPTRKRILRVLEGVAQESEIGKLCLLILTDHDRYYQYVSNYYPAEGEFSLFTPDEIQEKHLAFWNEATVQEFWSGKSWLRPDEANMLSYDLAKHFVAMIARDFDTFRAFANAAEAADSGDAAALEYLGYPVAHLAEAVLGKGPWQPKPETWREGVERGQFRTRGRVDPSLRHLSAITYHLLA